MTERRSIEELLAEARARLGTRPDPHMTYAATQEGALVLDVRSEVQRERDGAIPGALFHPRSVVEWRADPESGHDDPALSRDLDRAVIVICHEGYQSSLVAATLRDLGFTRATDLDGGFLAWRAAGLPVVSTP